jgi:hypothetical protein
MVRPEKRSNPLSIKFGLSFGAVLAPLVEREVNANPFDPMVIPHLTDLRARALC